MVQAIPEGYPILTAYILVPNASEAIEFYKRAFGAEERVKMLGPDQKVAHAELGFGDSILMLADEQPGALSRTPAALGGVTATFSIYVEDVDAAFERALQAGATVERLVEDQFYGDRTGTVRDPYGQYWSLMTHVEDVPPDEMDRRMRELAPQG
jgi:PhnB protein